MKKIIRQIYHLIPFKKQIFTLTKAGFKIPKRIYQHLTFKGDFTIQVDTQRSFKMKHFGYELENEMFWRGMDGWESVSFDVWIKLSKKSKVIFDVGANTGVFALLAKCVNPNAKVYAFEPVKRICDKIEYNNQINNYDIRVIQKAVAEYDGTATIYEPANAEHLYGVTVNENKNAPEMPVEAIQVETIKLATFAQQEKIDKIDLLKIDVESYEPQALQGLEKYLTQHRPSIIIEILDDEVGRGVYNVVKDLNYLFFKVTRNQNLVQSEHLINTIERLDDDHNFLLCTKEVAQELNLIAHEK
jgi:FkbM family methyltransferase